MPTPLDSKDLRISPPPISEEKELPFIDPRIKKIVASLLGASIGLGVAGAFCFTAKVSCAVALLVASVALGTLGLVVVANSLADRFFPQPLAKVVHAVHATVTDLLAFSFQLLFYAASPLCKERIRTAEGDDRPILFVHGYLHNASAWALYMFGDLLGLPTIGFKNMYAVSLPLFCSIEESTKIVKAKLEEIAITTQQNNVILIGHSMGGLVATRTAQDLQDSDSHIKITHVVTLGTPFDGARGIVRYFGFGENGKQMRPGSLFLSNLQSDLSKAEFKMLQVGSANDALVSEDSAFKRFREGDKKTLVSDIGHAALPLSLSLMDEVVEFLKSETV